MNLSNFIEQLNSKGKYCFSKAEAIAATDVSEAAISSAIQRLVHKGTIASPCKGFYVIVPPHYRHYGCLPAEQFIPDMMAYLQLPYYVGLLSAAQFFGAAHQKPQQFQVVTSRYLRPKTCGKIYTVFITGKNMINVPTRQFNTPMGYLKVSSPEATAIDLVRYPRHSGGVNNIVTVLIELVESMKSNDLKRCIERLKPEVVILQRLGYYLEMIEADNLATIISQQLKNYNLRTRPLMPGVATKGSARDTKWELFINYEIEPDI